MNKLKSEKSQTTRELGYDKNHAADNHYHIKQPVLFMY